MSDPTQFRLAMEDLRATITERDTLRVRVAWLEERLAETCDDHTLCCYCNVLLCETCGMGEPADCPSPDHVFDPHCSDCWADCGACVDTEAEDVRARRKGGWVA